MAVSVRSTFATFSSDGHHRGVGEQAERSFRNSGAFEISRQSTSTSFFLRDSTRTWGWKSLQMRGSDHYRPSYGLLKLVRFSPVLAHAEYHEINILQGRGAFVEAEAESSTLSNAPQYPRLHENVLNHREMDKYSNTLECGPLSVHRRAMVLGSMAAIGFSSSCSCCKAAVGEDWSYGGPSGPTEWGGTCAIGMRQSPIDVPVNKAQKGESLGELKFDYKLCTPSFKNPGHGTMQNDSRRYIHYLGSFTTPPCSESVDWILLETPLKISTTQVLEFLKFVGDEHTLALNARLIQPLGDRRVFKGP